MILPIPDVLASHALSALRALALYRDTTSDALIPSLPLFRSQATEWRALGYALEQRHGGSWDMLLQEARGDLRRFLQVDPADGALYASIMSLVLTLRHGPSDLRLAQPGLGSQLIRMAVCLEHCLILPSESAPPPAPLLRPVAFSSRDRRLWDVVQLLTVLRYGDQLPHRHRPTATELREVAGDIREAIRLAAQEGGQSLEQVWETAAHRRAERAVNPEGQPYGLFALSHCLHHALRTDEGTEEWLGDDGAIALCLGYLAVTLTPLRLPPLGAPSSLGRHQTVLDWMDAWGPR